MSPNLPNVVLNKMKAQKNNKLTGDVGAWAARQSKFTFSPSFIVIRLTWVVDTKVIGESRAGEGNEGGLLWENSTSEGIRRYCKNQGSSITVCIKA